MKTSTKIGIAAVAVLVIGAAVAGSAKAAAEEDKPDENKGKGLTETGVRHGIRYEGCSHFDLEDYDAVEAWAMANKWTFAKWALRLDEVRANPEPAMVDAFTVLFPECAWPPPPETTFGPERVDWSTAMALAKEGMANLDMAGPAVSGPAAGPSARRRAVASTVLGALRFALRERLGR